jgi:Zn-dependent protease/CBS domain-containing protein
MIAQGTRVGRLFGIDIRVDWSWAFVFILLTWNLISVFANWHPEWTRTGTFVVAVAASLLFFVCILLHELAHSLVAMAHGTRVRSITLFLFGGVSNIEREPSSPSAEILTAIVGPITSILLGLGFGWVAAAITASHVETADSALEAFRRLGPMGTLLAWLGPINVVIGLFNLVPAFPLDGGRVLRAILWAAARDLRKATRWAAMIGALIGWFFVAAGIGMSFGAHVPFFGTGLGSGLWLAFIGWFIVTAANQTNARMALDEALSGMTVAQLMQRNVPTVPPELGLDVVVQDYLVRGSDRAVAVVRDDRLLGLVCIADIRKVPPDQWSAIRAADVMRAVDGLTTTAPNRPLSEAFEDMARRDVDQIPVVVASGQLVGMLRRRDITRWLELAWRPTDAGPRSETTGSGRPESRAPGSAPDEPFVRPI